MVSSLPLETPMYPNMYDESRPRANKEITCKYGLSSILRNSLGCLLNAAAAVRSENEVASEISISIMHFVRKILCRCALGFNSSLKIRWRD